MRSNVLIGVLLSAGAQLAAQGVAEIVPATRVRVTTTPEIYLPASPRVDRDAVGDEGTQIEKETASSREGDQILSLPRPGSRLTGTLLAQDGDSVTIRMEGRSEPLRIPRQALAKIEVSRGRGSRGKGALIGLGLGFGVGFALGLPCGPAQGSYGFCGAGWGLLVGGFLAANGGLIGLAVPPGERWEQVPTARSAKAKLRVVPQRGGVGASVSIGF